MLVAYARTSTETQVAGLEDQIATLNAAGAEKMFSEQVSSMEVRPALDECLRFVRAGDCLMVTKPDRLARSTVQLLAIEGELTKRGIGLVILSMGGGERLDTRNPTSRLMLTILGGVAQWEREIMKERQLAGIAKAKAAGKFKGRKPVAPDKTHHFQSLRSDGMTVVAAAKVAGISEASAYRILRSEVKALA